MATKKRGQLSTSAEWARHLRPLLKRWFWKGERRAEVDEMYAEIGANYPSVRTGTSVEELLQQIESWPEGLKGAELWVRNELTLRGDPVANDVAMTIVLDAILAKGLTPAGKSLGTDGALYRYESS